MKNRTFARLLLALLLVLTLAVPAAVTAFAEDDAVLLAAEAGEAVEAAAEEAAQTVENAAEEFVEKVKNAVGPDECEKVEEQPEIVVESSDDEENKPEE